MINRSPSAPADLSRRSGAQRRIRRMASNRLFCGTNGCTTYLVPDETGRRAVCPICGFRRSIHSSPQNGPAPRPH